MSEKIKLRIRVGVTADGEWAAISQSAGHDDAGARDVIREGVASEPVAWYWVEAEVPRPVTVDETVEGTVTP